MLQDLPTLDELENTPNFPQHGAGLPPGEAEKYGHYVRPARRMMPEAGMSRMGPPQNAQQPPSQPIEHVPQVPQNMGPMVPHHLRINCIDIANHLQDCPLCSKFYDNNKTVYIIVIIVLVIVCLLLLKRVLNV